MLGVALSAALFAGMTQDVFAASVINGSYVKGDNENNPLVTQSYGADPGVMVYNDTVYIYTTNDSEEFAGNNENTYGKINQLNCYSSKDMVNWTDHGAFNIAGRNGAAKWANNSWAPTVCWKRINGKDKFFLLLVLVIVILYLFYRFDYAILRYCGLVFFSYHLMVY